MIPSAPDDRDVLAGAFHPSDPESAHATVAAAWLGPAAT